MWADGTFTHGAHTCRRINSEPRCGMMETLFRLIPVTTDQGHQTNRLSEVWTLSIKLGKCRTSEQNSGYHLCEFPQNGTESERLEVNITVNRTGQNSAVPRLLPCREGHLAHTFSACLAHSTCWAEDHVIYQSDRESWDIPSYVTCPAPLSPLPSSYACASGGDRVPYTFVCDHRRDCSDSSDESFCQHPPCGEPTPLQCGDSKQVVVVGWLLNVPATCECISGTDLLRQFYVLPH